MATEAVLLIKADKKPTMIRIAARNLFSVFTTNFKFRTAQPILSANPVSKTALPTIIIPATMMTASAPKDAASSAGERNLQNTILIAASSAVADAGMHSKRQNHKKHNPNRKHNFNLFCHLVPLPHKT